MFEEPMPARTGHALTDFDVSAHIGRNGTSFYDRATSLAVVGCQEALREAELRVDDTNRDRIGVVLGTSLDSFTSISDYSHETLVQDKPYMVSPMLFPNTVMNCAAGQAAIRFGLRGINATIAGGPLAFLNAIRYAVNAINRGYADVMLAGAVEEFSPHRAWAARHTGADGEVAIGEAAAVFVLARADGPAWAGRHRDAQLLAMSSAYGPGDGERSDAALEGCVRRTVHRSGVDPAEITTVLTGETEAAQHREYGPAERGLGHRPQRLMVKRLLGECDAASGAAALAVLLALHRGGTVPSGGLSLLTARGTDGSAAAAVVRGWSRDGSDRG